MNQDYIKRLLKEERLKIRSRDFQKIKSLLSASQSNAEVVLSIELHEKSATVIFREIYESIRQLGDAKWGIQGYEPLDHDISLEILKNIPIKNNIELNFLDRFRKIRNDANYRGFKVTEYQAKEIISFWNKSALQIIELIKQELE
ncbi:MAG: hypothetical protein AABX16_03040 [Nanoarchaeota archaeon]